ncbi:hypothetical protein LINPERPRIM_LOCUS3665 [Linum perenne]
MTSNKDLRRFKFSLERLHEAEQWIHTYANLEYRPGTIRTPEQAAARDVENQRLSTAQIKLQQKIADSAARTVIAHGYVELLTPEDVSIALTLDREYGDKFGYASYYVGDGLGEKERAEIIRLAFGLTGVLNFTISKP